MEKLAMGISMLCLLYIFLFFVLQHWLGQQEDERDWPGRWSGTKRVFKSLLRKMFKVRARNNTSNNTM